MLELSDSVVKLGNRIAGLPFLLLGVLALGLATIKSGIALAGGRLTVDAAAELPRAYEYWSANFGIVVATRIFGLESDTDTQILGGILVIAAAASVVILAGRTLGLNGWGRSLLVVSVFSLPAWSILLNAIGGRGDSLIVLGGVLLAMARSRYVASAGAFIMSSGNPEMALFAVLGLFLASRSQSMEQFRVRARDALVIATTVFLIIQLWFLWSGVVSTRLSLNILILDRSLAGHLEGWSTLLYALFGSTWPLMLVGAIFGDWQWNLQKGSILDTPALGGTRDSPRSNSPHL
jgi:hypothetical protein